MFALRLVAHAPSRPFNLRTSRLVRHDTLHALQERVGRWADSTFPHATLTSILAHLRDEVNGELSPEAPPSEAADCLLLLLHYAHKRDIDLYAAAEAKLDVNLERAWSEPDERGVSVHVEGD